MIKKYGLAIDPGMSNGICLFSWDNPDYLDGSYRQEFVWQVSGGASGLAAWVKENYLEEHPVRSNMTMANPNASGIVYVDALIVEKFTPHGGAGFSLTQASAEPLRGEGVLIGAGLERFIYWREPAAQYFMGGTDLKDRKKRSREFLKLNGIMLFGKQLGQPDADDAISAQLHAISYLRRIKHMPTLVEMFGPDE